MSEQPSIFTLTGDGCQEYQWSTQGISLPFKDWHGGSGETQRHFVWGIYSNLKCSVSYLVLKLGVILVLFLLLLLLLLLFTLISVWEVVVLYLAGFSLVDGALEVLVPWGPKGDCNAAHEKCCFMCILIAFTLMFITWLNPSTLGFYLSVIDNNLGWQFSAEIRFLMQYFFLVSLMSDILLFCLCNAS